MAPVSSGGGEPGGVPTIMRLMDDNGGAQPALSVRVRMLGATVAIAAVGMALAGSATYLVQRDQHLRELDE